MYGHRQVFAFRTVGKLNKYRCKIFTLTITDSVCGVNLKGQIFRGQGLYVGFEKYDCIHVD